MEPPSPERKLAAIALAPPLVYLLTERSRDVLFWRWSSLLLSAIAAYATFYVVWLASYRLELPRFLVTLRRVVIVSGSTLWLLLLAAEMLLAALDDAPYRERDNRGRHAPDPVVGHVYVPGWNGVIQAREFRTQWRSNAQGLRAGRDCGPKVAGLARVLAVGDSFTAGDQVPLEATWPAVLENCLRAALGAGAVEVFNAGFPGFGTVNEARWIARFAPALEPDLIVLAMTPNDLSENPFPLQYTALDGALVASSATEGDRRRFDDHARWWSLPGWVERSHLMRVVDPGRLWRRLRWGEGVPHRAAYEIEPSPRSRELLELAERHLLEAQDAARALGARFALITIPFRAQLGALGSGLDPSAFGRHWTAFGELHGFPVLDLLPAFRSAPDPGALFWREDAHCTADGYRIIGDRICGFLLERAEVLLRPDGD